MTRPIRESAVGVWLVLLLAIVLAGCGPRAPRAPALQDDPVYENRDEGFRFLVPVGWTQHARADAPPGPAAQDRLLVRYERPAENAPAVLEVSMADLPSSVDLNAYLAAPSLGRPTWAPRGRPEPVRAGEREAMRYVFQSPVGRPIVKEVVAVRRGERVYFFAGLFANADDASRDEIRRGVDSLAWTK